MLFSLSFCTPPGKFKCFTSLDMKKIVLVNIPGSSSKLLKNEHNKKSSNRGIQIIAYIFPFVNRIFAIFPFFSENAWQNKGIRKNTICKILNLYIIWVKISLISVYLYKLVGNDAYLLKKEKLCVIILDKMR